MRKIQIFALLILICLGTATSKLNAELILDGIYQPSIDQWLSGGMTLATVGNQTMSGYMEVNDGTSITLRQLIIRNGSQGVVTGNGTSLSLVIPPGVFFGKLSLLGPVTNSLQILDGATVTADIESLIGYHEILIDGEGTKLVSNSIIAGQTTPLGQSSELAITVSNHAEVIGNVILGRDSGVGIVKLTDQASWTGDVEVRRGGFIMESGSRLTTDFLIKVEDSFTATNSSILGREIIFRSGLATITNSTIETPTNLGTLTVGINSWEQPTPEIPGATLILNPGSSVNVRGLIVNESGTLNIVISPNPTVTTQFWFVNQGAVVLYANPNLPAGIYTPIVSEVGQFEGEGAYVGVGGWWNDTEKTFTISGIQRGGLFAQSAAGVRLGFNNDKNIVSFSSNAGIGSFEAITIDSLDLNGEALLAAYEYLTDLEGPALLSFEIGLHDQNLLSFWYRSDLDPAWNQFIPRDLNYDGQWASFQVTGFSSYAITVVPEPSSAALLLLAGAGWMAMRKRLSI